MASVVATVCERYCRQRAISLHHLIQLAGAITNIVFDPIFIFGYFGVSPSGIAGTCDGIRSK